MKTADAATPAGGDPLSRVPMKPRRSGWSLAMAFLTTAVAVGIPIFAVVAHRYPVEYVVVGGLFVVAAVEWWIRWATGRPLSFGLRTERADPRDMTSPRLPDQVR